MKIFAVDFDGTLAIGEYGNKQVPNISLMGYLIQERRRGNKVILWTCRTGEHLEDAVRFCNGYGLEFDAVNENLPEIIADYGGDTRKVFADFYIDDRNLSPALI